MKSLILACGLFLGISWCAIANDLNAIQGKWSVKKPEDNTTQTLEFKKDKWTFKILADSDVRFVAAGDVEVKKTGGFNVMRLHKMKYGSSESDLDPVDDERNIVFFLHEGQLYVASNFDRDRDNEKPNVDAYSKSAEPAKSAGQIAGTWKLDIKLGDNALDYTLRINESAGKLTAVLVSPRSGEHPVKSISLDKNTFKMQIDREVDGTPATFVYTGKLDGETLSGDLSIKGGDQNATGTWTAKK
jgi:hypothetical protein